MKKRMILMLIAVGILFGLIIIYKVIVGIIIRHHMASASHVVTVSTMKVGFSDWQPQLTSSANVRAINGVNVTTELAGMVQTIYFKPGATVKQGDTLVQLNADSEIGQLESLKAQAELARITYNRDKLQFAIHAVSQQTLDSDFQSLKNFLGQVDQQAATVAKKKIIAPFAGRLGISGVNLGQYLNVGDKVVTLQQLDPIWVDFYIPQQSLAQIQLGQVVNIKTDAFPGKTFSGKITTIDSALNSSTRNVEVEATVPNTNLQLTPGMFATAVIDTGKPSKFLTLPQTAISYNPYGDIVFIVNEDGKDDKGKAILKVKQAFVVTGESRGDQVQILKGLKEGDTVVTSGQLKLKNGNQIAVNNTIVPENSATPNVPNDH